MILPFTVLQRLDCVLAPTKAAVLAENVDKEKLGLNPEPLLQQITKVPFWSTSPLDLPKLVGAQDNIAANLASYVQAFAAPARDILERYRFTEVGEPVEQGRGHLGVVKNREPFGKQQVVGDQDRGLKCARLIREALSTTSISPTTICMGRIITDRRGSVLDADHATKGSVFHAVPQAVVLELPNACLSG